MHLSRLCYNKTALAGNRNIRSYFQIARIMLLLKMIWYTWAIFRHDSIKDILFQPVVEI